MATPRWSETGKRVRNCSAMRNSRASRAIIADARPEDRPCRATSARLRGSSGIASAAPVPSPSRISSSSRGLAPRNASSALCPGSAEQWAKTQLSSVSGFKPDAAIAAAVEMNPSTTMMRPCRGGGRHRARHHGDFKTAELPERFERARCRISLVDRRTGQHVRQHEPSCDRGPEAAPPHRVRRASRNSMPVSTCATSAAALVLPMPISP